MFFSNLHAAYATFNGYRDQRRYLNRFGVISTASGLLLFFSGVTGAQVQITETEVIPFDAGWATATCNSRLAPLLVEGCNVGFQIAYKAGSEWLTYGLPDGAPELTGVWQASCQADCWFKNPSVENAPVQYVFHNSLSWASPQPACAEGWRLDTVGKKCVWTKPVDMDHDCRGSTPNPIKISSGNKYLDEVDYQSATLSFVRSYNSRYYDWLTHMGNSWTGPYSASVMLSSQATTAYVRRLDGRKLIYKLGADGTWFSNSDVPDKLVRIGTDSWQLLAASHRTEIYGSNGGSQPISRLLSVIDERGHRNVNEYDADGRMIAITDDAGRRLTFAYDSKGRVNQITDPGGGKYSYAYDSASRLASVTFPDMATRIYHYGEATYTAGINLPIALTGITDEKGERYATYVYDKQGRAINEYHAGGVSQYTLAYSPTDNSVVVVTDPLGTQRTYNYKTVLGSARISGQSQPAGTGCGPALSNIAYDGYGNITSRTDFNGNQTRYTYDLTRNLEIQRIEAYGKTEQRTISTQWHSYWRLPVQVAEPLKLTTYVYNGDTYSGSVVNCAPTNAVVPSLSGGTQPIGVLCQKIEQPTSDANGSQGFNAAATGAARTWAWTYDNYGQVLTAKGPRTDVTDLTSYTYYDITDADMGKRGNLSSASNALGQVTQVTAYDLNSRPLTIVDPNGVATTLAYDPRGRLTSRSIGGETTTYTYDPVGQLTQITLPDGSSLAYTYDPAHRLVAIGDGLGNKIQYTLDAIGNRTKEEVFDPSGQLAQTRSRVFDALSRLYKDVGAQNQTTTYAYDANGNLTGVTDPLSRVTTQGFDALNRLIRITDPANGQTRFGYNGQDKLTQVTDPRNLITAYTVDGLGNQIAQQSPDTGTTNQTFDAAGNLKTKIDAKGQTTQYAYDALNRITQVTLADGATQRYTWDTGLYGIGRLAQIAELNAAGQETARTEYRYDPQGRVTQETRTIGGLPYVTAYAYSGGRLTAMTYPSGRRVDYTYDAAGRISGITTTKSGGQVQSVVSQVTYQPFGGVKSFTYGNGQTYTRSIDQDGRIASYSQGTQTEAIGYDAASRISFLMDATNPANTASYGYDSLDHLTSASLPNANYGYSYDADGNRTVQTIGATSIPYSISTTSNRLQSIGSSPPRLPTYDANGAITNDGNAQYAYDPRGRLTQATTAAGATSYQVNAQGERVRKSATNSDRLYHYDRKGHLIAEGGAQGQIDREYIYLNDLPVAVIVE